MRRSLLLLLVLGLAAPAAAQKGPSPAPLRIEILQSGLFRVVDVQEQDRRNGIAQATVKEEFDRATNRIPGRLGVNFGVRFRLAGQPAGATAPITARIVFPAPGLRPPGQAAPVRVSDLEMPLRVGDDRPTYRGFGFDEDWEIVPGTWRFEFLLGDELLAMREFIVEAPSR